MSDHMTSSVPYVVTNIDGLEPPKVDISYVRHAGQDGGIVQATRTGSRTVLLDIGYRPGLAPTASVSTLRQALYSYFPLKGEVQLRILMDDHPTVTVKGIVELINPLIFTKEPTIQVQIFSPLPYLDGLTNVSFGGMNEAVINPMPFLGSAETGFVFQTTVNRTIPLLKLKNGVQNDIVYQRALIAGDKISISTVPGIKYVNITRAGVTTPDIDGLANGSTLDMVLDARVSAFHANYGASPNDIPFTVTFRPKYIGI